jgi:ATP phosphoribosyltransferase regulatory subunit
MTDQAEKGLLPAGLQDILGPLAGREAELAGRLIACLAGQGYEQVKPPLLEFEESLLAGAGAALAPQTFRLMDPVSQRMMGLRADMTPQVVRIAASRLKNAARPLRLCYAGQVLQVRGSQLRPERQFTQVGAELIGAPQLAADAEVVLLAAEALALLGVAGLSVDLNLPPLVGALAGELGFGAAETAALRRALDGKDAAEVTALVGPRADPFLALLRAAGPADEALEALADLDLPAAAEAELAGLAEVVALIRGAAPALTLTIDPVEHRGFEYQTGISFIFFARGVRGELGRGGRYSAAPDGGADGQPATGFSLFMDTVLRALPAADAPRRLFLPAGHDRGKAAALRAQGWITVAGLDPDAGAETEAGRLGCTHRLDGADILPLAED